MDTAKKNTIPEFFFMHATFLVYSFVGIASKTAAGQALFSPAFFLFAALVVVILGVYALLWQQVLKRFTLARAYPNKGVVVIWNMLWAALFFQESITVENIIGSMVILLGIVLVSADAS